MRAFIVCGPVSSGNRLVAAILIRAGCHGSASTDQSYVLGDDNLVIIAHNPAELIEVLREAGYDPTLVCVIREPEANCRSMVERWHCATLEEARELRLRTLRRVFALDCHLEVITYEGLRQDMLRKWLDRLGLRIDTLYQPLRLVGQDAPVAIRNQNGKHYASRW